MHGIVYRNTWIVVIYNCGVLHKLQHDELVTVVFCLFSSLRRTKCNTEFEIIHTADARSVAHKQTD